MKKSVLLLDVDYTVINTDSMIDFFIYSLKNKTFKTIIKLPYIIFILFMYLIRIIPLKKAKEAIFYPIVDFSEEDLKKFFDDCIMKKINESMKKVIYKNKEEDNVIIMITASPYAYMKYFKYYGLADEVIGTEFFYENSRYKNKFIGENCKGIEKVKRIKAVLGKLGIEIDYENSYAYSDSKNDLPMLSLTKNAFLVSKKDGEVIEQINS
ncbi:haloacid dehalogenase-like hydrolase [Clostridioides difficile]|nr:haloacid dehalogenase-like hydrolase [Clostridioides difficile]